MISINYFIFTLRSGLIRLLARPTQVVFAMAIVLALQTGAPVSASPATETYRRKDISDARFGAEEKQRFLEMAYNISATVTQSVFGQDDAASVLQDRVVQYIEGFPNRKGEPAALNLIGLPGIGKTATLMALKNLGFNVVFMNAQNYINEKSDFAYDLRQKLKAAGVASYGEEVLAQPVIIVIDELDKVPEVVANQPERTLPIVGDINEILSEGHLRGTSELNLSNVLLISTMNFSSREMEFFSSEVLQQPKNYYDFTLEDFQKFDDWIRNQPNARYKILSKLFRSNTVSRLAPNTIIMQPLGTTTYRRIVELVVKDAISTATKPFANSSNIVVNKRVQITFDEALIDFLVAQTIFAPSGARETIFRASALMEQLINYGIKANDPPGADSTVDRPRKISIGVKDHQAIIEVTPQVVVNSRIIDKPSFSFYANYNRGARLFSAPENLTHTKPNYTKNVKSQALNKPITKKEVLSVRFPKTVKLAKDVEANINDKLIGQSEAISIALDDMRKYLSRPGPAVKEPSFRVLSGFPGIGKSELVRMVGGEFKLPIIKINMQQYASDSPDVIPQFLGQLYKDIRAAQESSEKFILQLEELDKVFEVDQQGMFVNRPIMAIIKDLLSEGVFRGPIEGGVFGPADIEEINIRSAFTFVTMNFAVDRFGFSADPRLTTADDVMQAWKQLSMTPMAVKQVLGSMFLPETVSRLMSRFLIMKPLSNNEYRKLIDIQTAAVIQSRLYNKSGRNAGQIQIKLSAKYKKYLFGETVIPSEGARYTVMAVQSRIASDIEVALASIPKSSKFASVPLILHLDFSEAKEMVVVRVQVESDKISKPTVISRRVIALQFPSSQKKGRMGASRLRTAAHEFGHAFVAANLGLRFEQITVVSPKPGIGGYVKFNDKNNSATALIVNVFSALGSRALERIVMSDDPLSANSVMAITSGPSNDIKQATSELFEALYELGFDPDGGTIDRNFTMGVGKYADFSSIPDALAEKLGLLLRDMENFIIRDLMAAHTQDWYVDKIAQLAIRGAVNEKSFYEIIGYNYPGSERVTSVTEHFKKIFSKYILSEPKSFTKSRLETTNTQNTSVEKNIEVYMNNFSALLKLHFHGSASQKCQDVLK